MKHNYRESDTKNSRFHPNGSTQSLLGRYYCIWCLRIVEKVVVEDHAGAVLTEKIEKYVIDKGDGSCGDDIPIDMSRN